jgi:HEPN domain-containing protein
MPADDPVAKVASEWVAKAENDLKNAAHTLKLGKDCPTDTVCFHAQQCVEKYLKALLVSFKIDFPKTHDISQLMALLPGRIKISLDVTEQRQLTDYATSSRYPGDYEPISLAEAKGAVTLARRVRKEIKKYLPGKNSLKNRNRRLF